MALGNQIPDRDCEWRRSAGIPEFDDDEVEEDDDEE